MTDEELSQREKRRQQHEQAKPKMAVNGAALKKWAWPLGLVLVVGGIVTAMVVTDNASGDCPDPHWHAAYTVYIDGSRVPFTNPAFNNQDNTYASGTHIHADNGVYHYHPAISKCTSWEDSLRHLGVTVAADALTLTDAHGARAGTYDEAPVRVFEQKWSDMDDAWQEVTSLNKFMDKQPPNGDGLVIIYGEHTQEEIDALLANAFTMKGNPSYDPHFESA